MISNPPYNIKWKRICCHSLDNAKIVPESNANFAFVMRALKLAQDTAAFILPVGCLTGEPEKASRKYLIDNGFLSAVLLLPQKMFESTSIPTCILFFEKNNKYKNTVFMDLKGQTETVKREQKGQYGGNSHTGRVYKKDMEVLAPEKIKEICRIIKERQDLPEWAIIVTHDAIVKNDYNLQPTLYLPQNKEGKIHRPLEYIIDDLNRINELRNVLKLVINEKKCREFGIYESFESQKESRKCTDNIKDVIEKLTGKKLIAPDFMAISKNRNEITFQNNHPERVSEILLSIFQMWKAHIMFMNNEENKLLAELRDALLPKLMGGEIDLSDIEIKKPEVQNG